MHPFVFQLDDILIHQLKRDFSFQLHIFLIRMSALHLFLLLNLLVTELLKLNSGLECFSFTF